MTWRQALMTSARVMAARVMAASAMCCALAAATATAGSATANAATATWAKATWAKATRPADASPPAGHLGTAIPIPGLAALNAGGWAHVTDLSCASPGFCTAVGFYRDADQLPHAFVVTETDFAWATATPVPGLDALAAGGPNEITALSCPAAGECTIAGWFFDPAGNREPFLATSADGVFGNAVAVFTIGDQHPQNLDMFTAISCVSPADCTAALTQPLGPSGGLPDEQAFLATETDGQWGPLRAVPGIPGPDQQLPTRINSVSCWNPGDCLAVGDSGALVGPERPILAVQQGGSWSAENTIPGLDGPAVTDFDPNGLASASQVSCWAATSCTVTGGYTDLRGNGQVFVADWVNGSWTTQTVPGLAALNLKGTAGAESLSCGAGGNCTVAGEVLTDDSNQTDPNFQSFAATRLDGQWNNAAEIPGADQQADSKALASSCPPAGSCVIGGFFAGLDHGGTPYIADEQATAGATDFGTFGTAEPVASELNTGNNDDGNGAVEDISCSFAGECAIAGFYTDEHDNEQGFVADLSATTATTVTASASTVAAGNEDQVDITAMVAPTAGGTPTGRVTVLATGADDQTTVCTITLAGGTGTCTLPGGSLAPGTYTFVGDYNGDHAYDGSTSAGDNGGGGPAFHVLAKPLATATKLTLSTTKIKAGHEHLERLTAQVKPASGSAPTGRVTIKAGSIRLCRVPLNRGQARCALTARQLRPGTYHLTARYGGDIAHAPSPSPKTTLTVTK